MAENKKSVLMYADWRDTFNSLSDANAGKLAKLIWDYINDENPKPQNQVVEVAFVQIKNTLKRDLKKWEEIKEKRKEIGKRGGEASAAKRTKSNQDEPIGSFGQPNQPVSVNVSVNVSDSVFHKEALDLKFENLKSDKYVKSAYDKYCYSSDKYDKLITDFYQNCLEKQYTKDYGDLVGYLSNFHKTWKDIVTVQQPQKKYNKI